MQILSVLSVPPVGLDRVRLPSTRTLVHTAVSPLIVAGGKTCTTLDAFDNDISFSMPPASLLASSRDLWF